MTRPHWPLHHLADSGPGLSGFPILLQILNYSEKPHSTISQLAMRPSSHLHYELGKAVDCWEWLWRSPIWKIQVRLRLSTQSPGRVSREQRRYLGQDSVLESMNDCNRLAESQRQLSTGQVWLVSGRTAWPSILGPSFPSSQISSWRLKANTQMPE